MTVDSNRHDGSSPGSGKAVLETGLTSSTNRRGNALPTKVYAVPSSSRRSLTVVTVRGTVSCVLTCTKNHREYGNTRTMECQTEQVPRRPLPRLP